MLGCFTEKRFAKTVWNDTVSELLEVAATGGCGGRQYLQGLKGLEKFTDNRAIKGIGRNVPSNIFNPMIMDTGGVWSKRAAEDG